MYLNFSSRSLLVLVGLAATAPLHAQWIWTDADKDASWSVTTNWVSGNVADTATESAVFGNDPTNTTSGTWNVTYDLADGTVIDGVSIHNGSNDFSAATTLNINGAAGKVLTFDNNIQRNAVTNFSSVNFNVNVSGSGSEVVFTSFAGGLNFNGKLTGSTRFRISGNSSITSAGANDFTGGIVFRNSDTSWATLNITNANGLSGTSGSIAWDGGTNGAGGTLNFTHNGTASFSNALDFGDTISGSSDTMRVLINRGSTIDIQSTTINNGSGNLAWRLGSNTSGTGVATVKFSGAGWEVSRGIELGTGASNTRQLSIEFANTSGVQRFSGAITDVASSTGALSLVRSGVGGTTVLSGTNTTVASVSVTGGTLLINGDSSGMTGAVTVGAAGTLGGIGIIGGATTVNGSVSAGDSTAVNTVGTLTFNSTLNIANVKVGGLVFDLGAVGASDLITVAGILTVGDLAASDFTFNKVSGFTDGTYTLLSSSTSISATSIDGSEFDLGGGYTGTLSQLGNSILLTVAIPEPSAIGALAGALVLGAAAYRRRRSRC